MIWTETFNAQYLLVEVNCDGKLIVLAKANHAMVDELVYPGERSIALLNKTRDQSNEIQLTCLFVVRCTGKNLHDCKLSHYWFTHHVMGLVFVQLRKEKKRRTRLFPQTNPPRIKLLFSYAKVFFCFVWKTWPMITARIQTP